MALNTDRTADSLHQAAQCFAGVVGQVLGPGVSCCTTTSSVLCVPWSWPVCNEICARPEIVELQEALEKL